MLSVSSSASLSPSAATILWVANAARQAIAKIPACDRTRVPSLHRLGNIIPYSITPVLRPSIDRPSGAGNKFFRDAQKEGRAFCRCRSDVSASSVAREEHPFRIGTRGTFAPPPTDLLVSCTTNDSLSQGPLVRRSTSMLPQPLRNSILDEKECRFEAVRPRTGTGHIAIPVGS